MSDLFLGRWRITEMEQWDSDYIDLIVPGYCEFGDDQLGYFQFAAVEGNIDYRIETVGGDERIEFTFDGEDEGDSTSGRGWAMTNGQTLEGRIYFHCSEESWFKSKKV